MGQMACNEDIVSGAELITSGSDLDTPPIKQKV
jgi:hypothetical protein